MTVISWLQENFALFWICPEAVYHKDQWNKWFIGGGGFEYLHRSSASCRKQRKENPVPRGITGLPDPPNCGSLKPETVKYGPAEPRHENDCATVVNNRPVLFLSERVAHIDKPATV
jgi:hypothetical protein